MSNLTNLEFTALDISGNNYLSWVLDAEIHLNSNNLGDTIKEGNKASIQDRAKSMIFLRHHLYEGLKAEYLTVKDPYTLWKNLKERFDHHKAVILPRARYEWIHLRMQDYKTVSEYNSTVFRITSQLILCEEKITDKDMLEKTFSTFHGNNMLLQQQYREKGFTKYSEYISCLLVAEQNNELLMKNHQSRPTGSQTFLEVNAMSLKHHGYNNGRGLGRGRDRGRGRGQGRSNSWYRDGHNHSNFKKQDHHNGKNDAQKKSSPNPETVCHRCGMKGHWERTCRTAKHLVDLYQASLKGKGKMVETSFAEHPPTYSDHLDGSDFFEDASLDIEQLIGDGKVHFD